MKTFLKGIKDGVPIALGYLSVSFGFGIMAIAAGLTVLQAVGISASNLTSAGQVAGVGIIAAGGSIIEMIIAQIVINIRYSLMGISLSQKLDPSCSTLHRMIMSFGITDEIFAVAYSQKENIKPWYMYGLIFIAATGWVSGTFIGAAAGAVLPVSVTNAMGILLYGMFIAVIVPAAKAEKGILFTVVISSGLSILLKYAMPFISDGFAVIICGIIAAVVAAIVLPVKEEGDAE
jgi:predicted branched-subunit amino acid permease